MSSFVSLLGVLGLITGNPDTPKNCTVAPLSVVVSERPNDDRRRPSAILSQGETDWLFQARANGDLLQKKTVVGGDPTVGGVTLSDGSGLSFVRDCRGVRCLYSGISTTAQAEACWQVTYDSRNDAGDLLLAGGNVVIRRKGKGSQLWLKKNDIEARSKSLLLLETASPIVGLNVSMLSIHGGLRTFDVIRSEGRRTLVLTTYVFDHKAVTW